MAEGDGFVGGGPPFGLGTQRGSVNGAESCQVVEVCPENGDREKKIYECNVENCSARRWELWHATAETTARGSRDNSVQQLGSQRAAASNARCDGGDHGEQLQGSRRAAAGIAACSSGDRSVRG